MFRAGCPFRRKACAECGGTGHSDAYAARTNSFRKEVETEGPPSVAGSLLKRLQIAEWHWARA